MRKIFWIMFTFVLVVVGGCVLVPTISQVTKLPDNMVVTYDDIIDANESDIYSSAISLSLPKNINVNKNGNLMVRLLLILLLSKKSMSNC